jgi:hypothetical protein
MPKTCELRLIQKFSDYRSKGQSKLNESVTRLRAHTKLLAKIRDAALRDGVDENKTIRLGMGVSGAAVSEFDAVMSMVELAGL